MTDFTPRPHQQAILAYTGGKMGIAAVPGAGKTHVLSALAARLIAEGRLEADQEVLVVTLVNSAVDNFSNRISSFIRETGLLPHLGYRVRTLHGLAHDIVREKPAAVGLETRFSIIDEREATFIRKEAVNAWLNANPYALDDYLDPALDDSKRDWVRRQQLPDMLDSLALAFIRSAKDRRLTPDSLRLLLDRQPAPLPLAGMGLTIYSDYQRALTYRGAVDFDDLIRLALDLLEADDEYLERLRYRFPYILEDEAQDSSLLQEQILRLIADGPPERTLSASEAEVEGGIGKRPSTTFLADGSSLRSGRGNWVRVGDPNQAIFETFTTASPRYLRAFIAEEADFRQELPVSGRSQPSIINLANYLIDWVMNEHPAGEVRDALAPPYIQPTETDDPQPNPPDNPTGIHFVGNRFTPEEELKAVIDSLARWLPENADKTVAVLVPRNLRGVDVISALKAKGLDYVEFLSSTSTTRAAAGSIANLLAYLSDPGSASKLSKAYQVWRRDWREDMSLRGGLSVAERSRRPKQSPDDEENVHDEEIASTEERRLAMTENEKEIAALQKALLATTAGLLRKVRRVEEYLSPESEPVGWLAGLGESEADEVLQELLDFRVHVKRWLEAVALPIDQLVLTLAQDVFTNPADLALAHKLALVLRSAADDHADWRLPELTVELAVIAKNERRFIGFSSDDSGFDPERHAGKVVVTTMHKAKGLEWERVYLMSVNNYDFPALQAYDRYISEKWFIRDGLNLEAEALAQLTAALSTGEYDWYTEGTATLAARADYVRERLRLFYVGLTRAKRELVVTWNTGRQGDAQPSLAMQALMGWWEESTLMS
jgi:DNA helicase-2/ATP-dependent DNA helicase PcrA